jgi:HK97 family phage portal protein
LIPWHPTNVVDRVVDGERKWELHRSDGSHTEVSRSDLVHFRTYNPSSLLRGMSPLEPLRSTLENETGARAANSAMWRNGGRPSTVLEHPGTLTDGAMRRLAASWAESHGGVDNWAKAAILEEGMTATVIPLNVEELQYIEARKLNREETCAAYDVPPPVVHILDRATFSNITEQMRSMYRDTMAPKLRLIESTLETELRDGRFGDQSIDPDFGEEVYAEFLMDEVLRGDFEARAVAYRNADFMTLAEKRAKENLPYIDGTDKIFINSASLPLSQDTDGMSPRELAEGLQKIYLAVGKVISADEAREILNRGGANLIGPAPTGSAKALPADALRTLMGRMSWQTDLKSIEPAALVAGINQAEAVIGELGQSVAAAESVDQFKDRLRALTEVTR